MKYNQKKIQIIQILDIIYGLNIKKNIIKEILKRFY